MSYAYLYDGSFEGLLTAVFDAYDTKRWPETVQPVYCAQLGLDQQSVWIETDDAKALRVEKGLIHHLGGTAWQKVWTAFLSQDADKATIIYRFIRSGLELGHSVHAALAHPDVLAIDRINKHTGGEAHLLRGFVRFSRMENGVYYARITPKNSVLPLLMPFFADRYNDQPLVIYDSEHDLAGVYDLKGWYLVETDTLNLPPLAEEEQEMRRLWKQFYKAVSIKERANPICRRSHMPKRYWQNMTEFNYDEQRFR